jgi:hypothetical protein
VQDLQKNSQLQTPRLPRNRVGAGYLSPATVLDTRCVLGKGLGQATKWGLIARNQQTMLAHRVTQGETVDECMDRAREANALHIEGLVARGLPVPEERVQPQLATISVAA